MRIIGYFLCSVFLLSAVIASNGNLNFYHNTPEGVIRGEEVKIEVMLTDVNSDIYDLRLFYRELGEIDYKTALMKREGFIYFATLNTSQFNSGQLQYYIGYEGGLGQIGTFPEEMPQINPFVMKIAPAYVLQEESSIEVIILSPLPDEVLAEDDIVVAATVFSEEEEIDYSNFKLTLDGVDIRNNVDFSDGVITYSPPDGSEIRGGYHNIEIQVFNPEGTLLAKKGWSFRSTEGPTREAKSFFRGSAFIEDRNQNIADVSDNFFRAGGEFSGTYNALDYRGRLVISSEEEDIRQPVNRYSGMVRYNFSEDDNVFIQGGDFNPYFNPIVLQDKRIRGFHAGLAFSFFTLDYMRGQLKRGINGTIDSLTSGNITDIIAVGGTYEQNMWAIRPGFRFGNNVKWSLNLVNAKEDPESIEVGSNVNESVSVGTDLNMNFDNRRILFDASFNASINNANAGLEEVAWDSLVAYDESLADNSAAQQAWDFLESTGWLSMTAGLNPIPSLAMQFDATFRYFYNNLKIRYYLIERDFATPGNPYVLKDVSGFHISDNIRLFENQVYLTLFYQNYTTNRSLEKEATGNSQIGVTLSYFPMATLPSLTVNYATLNRQNDVMPSDSLLFREDNSTQRLSFNTSYAMDLSGIRNTITLNYTMYGRDEQVNPAAQSDFNLWGVGLRTNFGFPLTSRLNYSQSENVIGMDPNKSTSKINTLLIGLDYIMDGALVGDKFKPFINYRWQQVESISTTTIETGRNNYTFGLAYQSPTLGVLSLRYDHITYEAGLEINGVPVDFDDSVLNFRYSYHF